MIEHLNRLCIFITEFTVSNKLSTSFTFQDFNTLIKSALRSDVVDSRLISEDVSEMLLPDIEMLSFVKSS